MKKIGIVALVFTIFIGCASYNTLDLSKLTTGMTKAQVRAAVGAPQRVLAINDTREGYQEVLEYRTRYDEVYALEFWNDYLTGVEFLYDDINYIPAARPPLIWPDYGRPIYVIPPGNYNRPKPPTRPTPPTSNSRPNTSSRPDTNTSTSPGSNTSTSRPSTSTESSTSTSRPSSSSQSSAGSSSGSGRTSTRSTSE